MSDTPDVEATPEPPEPPESPEPTPGSARPGLRRRREGRLLGGVCTGLADRLDVDVSIVRIAFVLLTVLWGVGVALYLALWLLVPESPVASASGATGAEGPRAPVARSTPARVAVAVVAIVAAIVAIAVMRHVTSTGPGPTAALIWLGVVVAAVVIALRAVARRGVLRVLATALVALVALGVLLTGGLFAYLGSTGVPISGGDGARSIQPTALSQVGPTYRVAFGALDLNLAGVTFPRAGQAVAASVAVGQLTVEVAPDVVVDLRTKVGLGALNTATTGPYGWNPAPFHSVPVGMTSVQAARAPHLTLDLQVGIGRLVVERR